VWLSVVTFAAVAALAGAATTAAAESMEAIVRTADGKPIPDAVVSAVAADASGSTTMRAGRAVVDQQDKEFVPHVRAVMVGTEVTFPNRDEIRHHVYSFSPAKKFELPLFKGMQSAPVTFDKPGVVVLGCNIHDWMLGYVAVLETPHFETTGADGRARIANLPAGTYDVHVWHPRLVDGAAPAGRRVTSGTGKDERVEFILTLKADVRPRRAPTGPSGGRYR
jgi:plastocyanin